MVEAARNPAAPSLAGRRFRFETAFVEEQPHKYAAFKQSARWFYDRHTKTLFTSVGFGQITDQNFDAFKQSGLSALPPLQSFFFDADVARGAPIDALGRPVSLMSAPGSIGIRGIAPAVATAPRDSFELADSTKAVSFGLAAPFKEGGVSALPSGMSPLEVSRAKGRRDHVERFARELVLVVEGQITDLGQKPQVFCGGYRGALTAKEITGYTPNWIKDRQCFVTARIDHVQVLRHDAVLSEWPKPAKSAD